MPSHHRPRRVGALLATLFLLAGVAVAIPGSASAQMPESSKALKAWAGDDAGAMLDALRSNPHKIPPEFEPRLKWADGDGSLQVMVALTHRDAQVESFVTANTVELMWYGDDPRFLGRATPEQVIALLRSPVVQFVEPDFPLTYFMSDSSADIRARTFDATGTYGFDPDAGPMGGLVSHVEGLNAEQVTGAGVRVAITDSGIDKTHRDFGGWDCQAGPYQPCDSRIVASIATQQLIDPGFDASDTLPLPTTELASGHGSHVAGTVAGNGYYTRDGDTQERYGGDHHVIGIAPNADIISVKNGDSQSAGFSTAALQWQLDHAAELGIRVSSNSWGCFGGCSFNGNSVIGQIMRDLYNAGVVVVFAVGNDDGGPDGARFSGYAQSPYVLGVAAYDDSNDRLASFSSRGSSDAPLYDPESWTPQSEDVNGTRRPDVAAPGVSIWSARTLTGGTSSFYPRANLNDVTGGGSNGILPYATMSGTSMATPHVAGAATVLAGACPDATALDRMRALMVGANDTKVLKTDGSAVAEPYEVGYGGLDLRASVDRLLGLPVCGGDQAWNDDGGGSSDPSPEPEPEPTAPSVPGDDDVSILDPFGDANYVNDQGAGVTGHIGEHTTSPDASSVGDLGKIWFTNTDRSVSVHVQTETKGPATEALFYRVQVDPGTGTQCLWFQGRTTGLGNPFGPQATLLDLCPDQAVSTEGRIDLFDGPDGTGIMSLTFPLSAHSALALGNTLASPKAHVRHYVSGVTFPQIDNTVVGMNYQIVAPEPEVQATQIAFADGSATSGQYSDEIAVSTLLTDADGDPIEGATVSFVLSGQDGQGSWDGTTGPDGVATALLSLTLRPGTYQLTAEYPGEQDAYSGSSAEAAFTIEKEDTACVLAVSGPGNSNRYLSATLSDEDSGAGIAGRTIEFYGNGDLLGTAATDAHGQASIEIPGPYRRPGTTYEARFGGDGYFLGSSDTEP